MCGRYTLAVEVADLLAEFPGLTVPDDLPHRFNIAPTQLAAVVPNDGRFQVAAFRWGLVPRWATDPKIGNKLINARAETLATKPSFREPLRFRRCLVLATGFFEWKSQPGRAKGPRTPVLVRLKGGRPFAIAGLWDAWRAPDGSELRSFTIVTTDANDLVAPVHDRMPALLTSDDARRWVDPDEKEPAELAPLLRPLPAALMELYTVSRVVNSPALDLPECLEPEPLLPFSNDVEDRT